MDYTDLYRNVTITKYNIPELMFPPYWVGLTYTHISTFRPNSYINLIIDKYESISNFRYYSHSFQIDYLCTRNNLPYTLYRCR